MPQPGGGELRGGVQQPFQDHRQDPVALRATLRRDEPFESQTPGHREQRFDMAVGQGAFDRERILGGDEPLALEDLAQRFDLFCGPVGEIGERFLAHPLALAPALAKEDRGAGVAVGYGLDVHGNEASILFPYCQLKFPHLHGNINRLLCRRISIRFNYLAAIRPQNPGELRPSHAPHRGARLGRGRWPGMAGRFLALARGLPRRGVLPRRLGLPARRGGALPMKSRRRRHRLRGWRSAGRQRR